MDHNGDDPFIEDEDPLSPAGTDPESATIGASPVATAPVAICVNRADWKVGDPGPWLLSLS